MIVVIVKEIFRDHIFLEALLCDLAFEEQAPHRSAGRVRSQICGSAVVRLVPPLIIPARIPREKDIRAFLTNPTNEIFDHRLAILKFEQPVVIAQVDVVVPRNTKLCKRRQFFLAANLRELHSRQIWILRADIPSGQRNDINLISVGLKHRERAVRQRIVVGVSADQHDGFPSPLIDRDLRLLFLLLRQNHWGQQRKKKNSQVSLQETSQSQFWPVLGASGELIATPRARTKNPLSIGVGHLLSWLPFSAAQSSSSPLNPTEKPAAARTCSEPGPNGRVAAVLCLLRLIKCEHFCERGKTALGDAKTR